MSVRDMWRREAPPESLPYDPKPRMSWLDENDIPEVPHHRSLYMHIVNYVLETACRGGKVPTPDPLLQPLWQRVQEKIFVYWIRNRADLDPVHRRTMWHVWARFQFVMRRRDRRLRDAHLADYVTERRIRVARDASVGQYTVTQLWRAIMVLLTAWNTTRYSRKAHDYAEALATQCGRYFWTALPSRQIFNHPSFVERVENADGFGVPGGASAQGACYCVNDAFISETERIFSGLLGDLFEHTELTRCANEVEDAPPATSYEAVHDWMRTALDVDAIREFVDKTFVDETWVRRALIGEVERFEEKNPYLDATPFNAIANTRKQVIDDTSALVEKDTWLEDLLERTKMWGRAGAASASASATSVAQAHAEFEADSDADTLVVVASGYLLDGAFESDMIRFSSWFLCRHARVPSHKNDFPVMVRACHAWHVQYKKRLWLCKNSIEALECWVRVMCSSSDPLNAVKVVIPRAEPLYAAHNAMTNGEMSPAEVQEKREAAERESDALMLPSGYSDEEE